MELVKKLLVSLPSVKVINNQDAAANRIISLIFTVIQVLTSYGIQFYLSRSDLIVIIRKDYIVLGIL